MLNFFKIINQSIFTLFTIYFSIFKKGSSDFIGTIVLTSRNQNLGEMLLEYLINKEYWGNHYVKEGSIQLVILPFSFNIRTYL